jgi:hypothetical protein
MSTEIIFALFLSAVFLGAIAWLVIYSRLQLRGTTKGEMPPAEAGRCSERRGAKGAVLPSGTSGGRVGGG